MGISINPDSWYLHWAKNKKDKEIAIANYLDEIALDATNLANIWENIANAILTEGTVSQDNNALWKKLLSRPELTRYSNSVSRSRLDEFYDSVSKVMGENHQKETDYIVNRIGFILYKRELNLKIVEEELNRIKSAKFFDDKNYKADIKLIDSVEIFHKEAASLYIFAKEFRAKV